MKPFPYTEILDYLKSLLIWLIPTVFGVSAKLAYDSRYKKITKQFAFTSLVIACFIGYIADRLCTSYGLDELRGVIVALSALASEPIISYIIKYVGNFLTALIKRIFNLNVEKPTEEVPDQNDPTV